VSIVGSQQLARYFTDTCMIRFTVDLQALGVTNADAEIAVVVVHGSDRNADDYFCSMLEAARLQKVWSEKAVLIVAPRFTELEVVAHHRLLCHHDRPTPHNHHHNQHATTIRTPPPHTHTRTHPPSTHPSTLIHHTRSLTQALASAPVAVF
jgi:hypothetical protein